MRPPLGPRAGPLPHRWFVRSGIPEEGGQQERPQHGKVLGHGPGDIQQDDGRVPGDGEEI